MKSIKTAVWIRAVAIICSLALFTVMLLATLGGIRSAQSRIMDAEELSTIAYASEVAHYSWASNLSSALYESTEFTGSAEATGCVLGKWIYGKDGTADETVKALVVEMEPLHKAIHESAAHVLDLHKSDQLAATRYYREKTQTNIRALVGLLNQVVERATVMIEASNEEMDASITQLLLLSSGCVVIVIVCLFSLVQYVIKMIVRPIIRITEESRNLADGVLRFHVDVKGKGELAQLSHTLEDSVQEISSYVQDIESAMGELAKGNFNVRPAKTFLGDFKPIEDSITTFLIQISKTITQIDHSATLVSGEAEQFSAASQGLSQGATEQAASIQELASTIENILHKVESSAKNAVNASKMSQETLDELAAGKEQMNRMISAMDDINSASQEIGKIISTIENIAFQTNILALNAAVEAARAGSAGKGFAVVADEVRNLAGKSAEASQNTSTLIANSIRSVREGTEIAAETARSLEKIVASSSHAFSLIENITVSAQDEAEALTRLSVGIGQIASVVQMNSATAEESAAASEELSSQSQMLKSLVEKFCVLELPNRFDSKSL